MISTGGRTAVFSPGDIDNTLSTAQATVYVKKSGSTTDTLTLTKPGTSGHLTYQYVGGGYWQRTVTSGSAPSGSLDAFSYGIPTVDAAVPRSGRAEFSVDLIGAGTYGPVVPLAGKGLLQADFGRGVVVTDGTLSTDFFGSARFSGEAALTSTNFFRGAFRVDAERISPPLAGYWEGRFYGPASEEVGASFAVNDRFGTLAAVGTLIGRQVPAVAANPVVNAPEASGTFDGLHASLSTELQVPFSVDTVQSTFIGTSQTQDKAVIAYDAASNSYSFVAGTRSGFSGATSSADSLRDLEVSGRVDRSFALYAPTGGRYVTVGRAFSATDRSFSAGKFDLDFLVFGIPTLDASLPHTGKAGYSMNLVGTAADKNYNTILDLHGAGSLVADFAAGTFTLSGSVNYREDYSYLSHPSASGRSLLSGSGTISSGANAFTASMQFDAAHTYSGTVKGGFYGPTAQEFGAVFTASDATGNRASGALFGALDPLILSPSATLTTLATPTALTIVEPLGGSSYGPRGITQNSAMPHSYEIHFSNFGAALHFDEDVVASTARYIVLGSVTDSGTIYSGKMLKAGADNPLIALTYTSFADFSVARSGLPGDRTFTPFGLATTAANRPRAGMAYYSGVIAGVGGSHSRPVNYDLSGTSSLSANFGTDTFWITLNPVGTPSDGGADVVFNPLIFTGAISTDGNMAGADNTNGRNFLGQFFGPNAQEFGGVFESEAAGAPSRPDETWTIKGVTVGKQ
jgi:hypothetical protein